VDTFGEKHLFADCHMTGATSDSSGSEMQSRNYADFERAMKQRQQVVCMYGGHRRELCPIILVHSQGRERALTYQFGGDSSRGLPRGGQWRCLSLSRVSDVELRDGPWIVGSSHSQPQGCVEVVDLDVNPSSPYQPRRPIRR
jgi:hypothetical protein